MKFSDFFWPDSSLEQIRICYDAAELTIWNRSMNHSVTLDKHQLHTKKGGAVWRCMPLATCICL